MHTEACEAENRPLVHELQLSAPCVEAFPAVQPVQPLCSEFGIKPAAQAAHEADRSAETVPSGHGSQTVPYVLLFDPAGHVRLVHATAPLCVDIIPAGHALHIVAAKAPSAAENLPAGSRHFKCA